MYFIRQTNSRKGVAIFFVLFVMIILGILVAQFHISSRHAQSSVHRFQTSEMARQLAAAAQEEAFKYIYDNTDNYESKSFDELDNDSIIKKIIDGRESSIYVPNFNRTDNNGIKLSIPATKNLAENILGDRMEVTATARIIDFRDCDSDNHTFYGKEGIGTIEIITTAKAKDQYKNLFPGACTIVRHHDYKVVSLLSKKDRVNYSDSSVLDYALFIRKGQDEFGGNTQNLGFNINPPDNTQLAINAGSGPILGKVHFGTDMDHYTYLNISDKTKNFIPNGINAIPLPSLTAEDKDVDKFFPYFSQTIIETTKAKIRQEVAEKGAKLISSSVTVTGHKAIFEYKKLPITNEYINTENLQSIRDMASINAIALNQYVTNINYKYYDGIKIYPQERLSEVLDSDIRKQYFNFGYWKLDLSDCKIHVYAKAEKDGEKDSDSRTKYVSENPEIVNEYKNKEIPCFNNRYFAAKNLDEVKKSQKDYNYEELYKFIMEHDDHDEKQPSIASRAFTFINNEYSYQLKDEPPIQSSDNFYNREYNEGSRPSEAQYPFAHFNLFNKRYINNDKPEELEELGIYNKKENILTLRGIIQCSNHVELGDEKKPLKVKGSGVLIARGITIRGAIEKDNKKSIVVLFSRNGDIRVKTSNPIEAALIAMKGPDGDGINQGVEGRIIAEEQLNLKGSLAVDRLSTTLWKKGLTHKIYYDEALVPVKDVYQVNIAKWVTYERVLENE